MRVRIPVTGGVISAYDSGGAGAPLVLLHAGWSDQSSWAEVAGRLADDYRVISYDGRGYGESPPPSEPFTQLGDLVAVLDWLDVPRAAVAGHSGGGGTAVGLALADPARVASLVLLAPGVPDYPWPPDDPFAAEFATLTDADDRAGLTDLGLRTWAAAGAGDAVRAQIEGAVAAMFAIGDFERPDPPAFGRLGEITAPTMVVLGDREYPMVTSSAEAIAAGIPGCRRLIVPGADHLLPLRAPELVADLIRQHTAQSAQRP